jgi:hypothetical protein
VKRTLNPIEITDRAHCSSDSFCHACWNDSVVPLPGVSLDVSLCNDGSDRSGQVSVVGRGTVSMAADSGERLSYVSSSMRG